MTWLVDIYKLGMGHSICISIVIIVALTLLENLLSVIVNNIRFWRKK